MEIPWTGGSPQRIVDADGAPVLIGDLQPFATPSRASFVPIDLSTGAGRSPSTIVVTSLQDRYQTVRALRFVGNLAGAIVDTWGPGRSTGLLHAAALHALIRLSC